MTLVAERIIETRSPTSSLDELAALGRGGDTDALDRLLRTVRPLAYRWAWMQTGDTDDADDVSQNVMLKVHKGIARFDGRSSFTTWLYRITSNACIEHQRSRSSWLRLRDKWKGHAQTSTSHTKDVVDVMDEQRGVEVVQHMMTLLSAQQRAAIDLVDMQGYEPIEAARMMDMNPATLRTHLLRGRKALRAALLKEEYE
jgi:RNA polymerase sigma-70 factor (ECF subfamily)